MQNNTTIPVPALDRLSELAEYLLIHFGQVKVWAFEGEMGAGKTTLIQAILGELGITNPAGSPTYSLVNEYDSADGRPVYHFDLYRLDSLQEALDIGIEEIIYGPGLSLIEWPELAKDLLPKETIWFKLSILEDNQNRTLTICP